MLALHDAAAYDKIRHTTAMLDEVCALLDCPRADLLRMLAGLEASVALLRRRQVGGTVDETEVAALPKRFRKPFKRRRHHG